jgi:hypothetical protein
MYIRQLDEVDLKYSFYDVMALTSEENIELINTRTVTELFHKLNHDHKIFVIVNLNTNGIIGTGTITILNQNTAYNVCIIKDIKIHKDYYNSDSIDDNDKQFEYKNKSTTSKNKYEADKDDLYTIFLQCLIDYSHVQEKCIKYILKLDSDKTEDTLLHLT